MSQKACKLQQFQQNANFNTLSPMAQFPNYMTKNTDLSTKQGKDVLPQVSYQTSLENLAENVISSGKSLFTHLLMFQNEICNKTNYHAKHDRNARKQLQARNMLQALEKKRILWAKTRFWHVFHICSTKRAKTHAKRCIFLQIPGEMPEDSLLHKKQQTH